MHIVVLPFHNYSNVPNIFKGTIRGFLSEKFIQSSKKRTSKSTSSKQPQVAYGPIIFSTSSLLSFCIVNFGRKGSQFCTTYPAIVPGGD